MGTCTTAGAAGAVAITGLGGAATTTGAEDIGLLSTPGTVPSGGRATTAPVGGRLAIAGLVPGARAPEGWAGIGGGATMRAPWFGKGTMRRGAGTAGGVGRAAGAETAACTATGAATIGAGASTGAVATTDADAATEASTTTGAGVGGGGATATTGRAGRGASTATGRPVTGGITVTDGATAAAGRWYGAFFAAASAFLRSRIARMASPGLDTLERSNCGRLEAGWVFGVVPLRSPSK